jgi:hypothetical protein
MKRAGCGAGLILLCWTGTALAEGRYAHPPSDGGENSYFAEPADSTVRVSVGPALRVGTDGVRGGLVTALDIGAKAAGGRLSAAWARAGSDGGLSQYTAELWVDFGVGRVLRPIVGAGAGIARVDAVDAAGSLTTSTLGLGVLRGTLEYVLPVAGADARVGIDLSGALPAIRGSTAPGVDGWLVGMARVGVGF